MNYLLFHLGKIPKHFYTCVNNILSIDKDAKIFVLTDNDLKLNAVEILNINGQRIISSQSNSVNMNNLQKGIYLIKVFGENEILLNMEKVINH